MWPWEHLAFGYVLFSLLVRIGRRRPDDASVYLLVLFTQFPDLVDKPLAWTFGILLSGLSVGHSVFVALSVSVVALALGHARGRGPLPARRRPLATRHDLLDRRHGVCLEGSVPAGEPRSRVGRGIRRPLRRVRSRLARGCGRTLVRRRLSGGAASRNASGPPTTATVSQSSIREQLYRRPSGTVESYFRRNGVHVNKSGTGSTVRCQLP